MTHYLYLRVYFERSNGRIALDSGPNTKRTEVANFVAELPMQGEHSQTPGARPRFWNAVRNCTVRVVDDIAYIGR